MRAATAGAFLLAPGAAAVLAPAPGLSLLAGGLVGYLALFAGVVVGRGVRTG